MRETASLRTIAAEHGAKIVGGLSFQQHRSLERIATCQTSAQGYHQRTCTDCEFQALAYNSCRDRACPRCLRYQAARWFSAREAELLPVPYFHLVFTVPRELRSLLRQNQAKLYGLLFQASAQALLKVASDPKRLGAQLGFFGVLHTWGRDLRFHPHIHWVIPGGGLAPKPNQPDSQIWVEPSRPNYFLPVQVLAPVFRGKFLAGMRELYRAGDLKLDGPVQHLTNPKNFENLCRILTKQGWHVHAEPPFAGPEKVLGYLARYTHRTAIGDERIVAYDGEKVTFRFKDNADGGKQKLRTLSAEDFLRRFSQHVLPRGFQRIRYYGFLANRHRAERLRECRQLLGVESPMPYLEVEPGSNPQEASELQAAPGLRCPDCGGKLEISLVLRPHPNTIRPFSKRRNGFSGRPDG